MAVKKTQMYRRNLDGTETGLNPLTESQYVLMENGQTVQEVLSDRDSDKYTPVITNSSSTFKVGQGDNVDLSSSMKEGAYDSCVLKGKTMVNCIQEPSSQDVVLPYAFADGQYVTINDTKESGALGVELKGQTLVNVHGKKAYSLSQSGETIEANKFTNIVKGENQVSFDMMDGLTYGWGSFVNGGSLNLDMLKPNTKYLAYFGTAIFPEYFGVSFRNGDGTNLISTQAQINKGGNYAIITTTNEIVKSSQILYISIPQQHAGHYGFKDIMVIEYQEGMENWDIPHFEGMTSCKMPILKSVGKNLFDGDNFTRDFIVSEIGTLVAQAGNGATDYIRVLKGNTYIKKRNNTIAIYDINKKFIERISSVNSYTAESDGYIRWNIDGYTRTDDYENGLNLLQIEEGSTATTYEPHKSSILSLPEEVVLRSLPNGVCDTFNTRTGVHTQRIKEVVFDGSDDEAYSYHSSQETLHRYISNMPDMKVTSKQLDNSQLHCDKWATVRDNMVEMWSVAPNIHRRIADDRGALYFTVDGKSNVAQFREYLSQNPITVQYELATPIVTKVNLSSILKSWNTTTHIYSEIPENTLYPILSHSNPTYPVILKPSTKYSIVANSYSNSHTNSAINFNLGGATASTTVGNRVTTITTPSTLSNELLAMSGRGNKLNNVMVIEGDVVGDEPYFEGICDCKSPILSNCGKNLLDIKNATKRYSSKSSLLNNGDGSVSVVGDGDGNGEGILVFSCCVYLKEGETYFFSFESDGQYSKVNGSDTVEAMLLRNASASDTIIGMTGFANTFVCPRSGDYYLRFDVNKNNVTHKFWNVYLAQVSTDSPYEPYKSNTTTFEQKDGKTIVLRSLRNGVCDTLNVETGEYVQRIGEKVLNGSESWYAYRNDYHGVGKSTFQAYCTNDLPKTTNNEPINCNRLVQGDLAYDGNVNVTKYQTNYVHNYTDGTYTVNRIFVSVNKEMFGSNAQDNYDDAMIKFKSWVQSNPITVHYQLATPIVSTVDVQGFPYAYTNGHVQLSSGSIEQSLTPTVEYSLSANKTGQINSNTKRVSVHQKQLDDFEAMMLTSMVQSAYDKAILQFDYEMQMMSLGGE